jgi:hypothetical protein
MCEVVKKEVIKLLDTGIIYPMPHSEWVSPVHCIPKKGGITVVKNEKDELIPQRIVTGWRMCILTFVSLMDTRGSCKFPFIRMINKRQPSQARMELSHIKECHLVYVMHPPLFKDA